MDITKAALYKHGVGFFERKAEVEGDEEIHLYFNSDQMNDVLKSLNVSDLGGGYIANISYDSKKEEQTSFSLKEGFTLDSLISQLAGISISVEIGGKKISGTVLGLQTRNEAINQISIKSSYLVLSMEKGISQFSLSGIDNIVINDEEVSNELKRNLDKTLARNKKDKKRLTIYCRGKGKRELLISYLSGVSAWKASYRIRLNPKEQILQGWGLVDNDTEEDWNDIQISLIDGKPISFTYDLYAPHYPVRPHVNMEREAALAPMELEEAYPVAAAAAPEASLQLDEIDSLLMAAEEPGEAFDLASGEFDEVSRGGASRIERSESSAKSSFRSQTEVKDAGDLCEYRIVNPVTVRNKESASLPLFQKSFEGKPLLVYNRAKNPANPMSVIEFNNTMDISLNGGPLLVIEEGAYVGEAMLPAMKPDEQRLIPYSVELGVKVKPEDDSDTLPVHFIETVDGLMYQHYYLHQVIKYTITNKNPVEKELVIEHPRWSSEKLVKPEKAEEETENYYRFRITLKPQSQQEFTVITQHSSVNRIYLPDQKEDSIALLMEKKYLTKEIADQLSQIFELMRKKELMSAENKEIRKKMKVLADDQGRIRDNLKALGDKEEETKIKSRYLEKLAAQEDELENYVEKTEANEQQIKELEQQVSNELKKINFEVKI